MLDPHTLARRDVPLRVGEGASASLLNRANASELFACNEQVLLVIEQALRQYDREVGLELLLDEASWADLPSLVVGFSASGKVEVEFSDEPAFDGCGAAGPSITMMQVDCMPQHVVVNSMLPLLPGWPVVNGHTVYAHVFMDAEGDAQKLYVGVTKRSWALRLAEHRAAAKAGSPYLFHDALRRLSGGRFLTKIIDFADTYEGAMRIEEAFVEQLSLYPKGLNMIPGGFAGIKYLADRGFSCGKQRWEYRHKVFERFAEHCVRSGQHNPLSALHWRDDDYAANVICNNPRNFNRSQVGKIRLLDSFGQDASKIAEVLRCNEARIRKLLRGSTYRRVASS